jgi:hypothetical protein
VHEDLTGRSELPFSAHYQELLEVELEPGGEHRPRWFGLDLPAERRASAAECLHAGLLRVDALGAR